MTSPRYQKLFAIRDGHIGGLTAVAFSSEGNYIATAGYDNKVCIWKVEGHHLLHTLDGRSRTLSLAWQHESETVLFCGMQDGTVSTLVFSHPKNPLIRATLRAIALPAHNAPVECLAVPRSRPSLASGAHGELFIWKRMPKDRWAPDFNLGLPPRTSHTRDQEIVITSLHWTRTRTYGSVLLVTYLYHGVVIFDSHSWDRLRAIPIHGCIADASISPDSSKIVISNVASGFDIYDMDTGASSGSMCNPAGEAIRAVPVQFAHGGNAIVGGSTAGSVHVWETNTTSILQVLPFEKNVHVLALSVHHDSVRNRFLIATGISQSTGDFVVLWSAEEHRQTQRWKRWILRASYEQLPPLHWDTFVLTLKGGLLVGIVLIAWTFIQVRAAFGI